ncbi:hypothetical protein KXJ72_14230 [Comamonas aquatica]|nr:hypothetical protein KXJ72_14230 [Comamonas aquatica]
MKFRSSAHSFFLFIIVYFYLYAPPIRFLPVNISIIISIIVILFSVMNNRKIYYITLFKSELLILGVIFLYASVLSAFGGGLEFISPFLFIFIKIPICVWICCSFDKLRIYSNDGMKDFIRFMGVLAGISATISIVMWLNIEWGEYVKFDVLKYDRDLMQYQMHRAFGFADEFLFTYSIVQACIWVAVFSKFGVNRYTFLLFILVFISISLNARIGYLFLFFSLFSSNFFKIKSLYYLCFIVPALIFLLFIGGDKFDFLLKQFDYFLSEFYSNNDSDTLNILLKDMIFLPEDPITLLFGSGTTVFGLAVGGSDSGYVNLIFFGGLIYFSIVLFFFVYCFYRGGFYKEFFLSALLFIMFFIASFKGPFFYPKPGMNLYFLMYVGIIYFHRDSKHRKISV